MVPWLVSLMRFVIPGSKVDRMLPWVGTMILWLLVWITFKPVVFPSPLDVVGSYPALLADGLLPQLWTSVFTNIQAILLSVVFGLPLSYLSRVPIVEPLGRVVAYFRFLSPSVFYIPLGFILYTSHDVKIAIMTLGMLFYLVTTMRGVIDDIPSYRYDDALTLRMGPWQSLWYVTIRGTVPQALGAIKDNAAMGWGMLMFVEALIRSEGGIGVMLINFEKHIEWPSVWGLIGVILIVGIAQDWIITQVKNVSCPYA